MIDFNGRVHLNFAILVWIGVQMGVHDHFLNPIPFLFATLFPDSDCKTSPIGKLIPLWLFFNHRGFTHSLIGCLTFSFPILLIFGVKWFALFICGYLLHLVLDSGTPMSIRWVYGHRGVKKRRKAY